MRMLPILVLLVIAQQPGPTNAQKTDRGAAKRFAIAIHGGAGSDPAGWTDAQRTERSASLERALAVGTRILSEGGTSLDAVERVIRMLEDDPRFNAGRGAVFNAAGGHELDASIMDGRTRACGAVAGVRTIKNPISTARLVMQQTRHVLLAGDGAETFATKMNVERVDQEYFFTQERFDAWKKAAREADAQATSATEKSTVGCVALDQHGNLAAGTSTGGLTNKMFGRVGDSPIVGAGTYADNATCAVSGTGIGEQYIRHAAAHDVSARMAYLEQSLEEAVGAVIHGTLNKGDGGLIAVDHEGNISMQFNTAGMSRAAADSSGFRQISLGAN